MVVQRIGRFPSKEKSGKVLFSIEKGWGGRRGLNPRHSVPQTDALPAELLPPLLPSLPCCGGTAEDGSRSASSRRAQGAPTFRLLLAFPLRSARCKLETSASTHVSTLPLPC